MDKENARWSRSRREGCEGRRDSIRRRTKANRDVKYKLCGKLQFETDCKELVDENYMLCDYSSTPYLSPLPTQLHRRSRTISSSPSPARLSLPPPSTTHSPSSLDPHPTPYTSVQADDPTTNSSSPFPV